jgi:mannose/fructose/N-acetylgalactosamine-specific phosphotransferase system component IIC
MFKFEETRLDDLVAIVFLGLGFVLAVFKGYNEIALAVSGALGGYMGAVINNSKEGKNDD